jgi:hypothetical protein
MYSMSKGRSNEILFFWFLSPNNFFLVFVKLFVIDPPAYSAPGRRYSLRGVIFTNFQEPTITFTGTVMQKLSYWLLLLLHDLSFIIEKFKKPQKLKLKNWFLGGGITEESITNMNNSTIIWKNWNLSKHSPVLGCLIKNGDEKSRDTLLSPVKYSTLSTEIVKCTLKYVRCYFYLGLVF